MAAEPTQGGKTTTPTIARRRSLGRRRAPSRTQWKDLLPLEPVDPERHAADLFSAYMGAPTPGLDLPLRRASRRPAASAVPRQDRGEQHPCTTAITELPSGRAVVRPHSCASTGARRDRSRVDYLLPRLKQTPGDRSDFPHDAAPSTSSATGATNGSATASRAFAPAAKRYGFQYEAFSASVVYKARSRTPPGSRSPTANGPRDAAFKPGLPAEFRHARRARSARSPRSRLAAGR